MVVDERHGPMIVVFRTYAERTAGRAPSAAGNSAVKPRAGSSEVDCLHGAWQDRQWRMPALGRGRRALHVLSEIFLPLARDDAQLGLERRFLLQMDTLPARRIPRDAPDRRNDGRSRSLDQDHGLRRVIGCLGGTR